MRTRCKFRLREVTAHENGAISVKMSAVAGGTKENEQFCKFTPQGSFDAYIDNPVVAPMMRPGREFYLDLTPADQAEANADTAETPCAEHRV